VKALVYLGPKEKAPALQERPKPTVTAPTDAIVKMTLTTICGTDLHILKGDVATCEPGRILGHEGVGVIEEVGGAVTTFKPGDRVLISCITACGKCVYCRKLMYSHCTNGGWILGNKIDGTQAEFVRIPFAETSLYPIPAGADEEALVMLSDILPTGFECGVLNGKVQPGCSVAIVGSGPIGLAALLTAQFYSPAEIIMIDLDDNRLEVAKRFGATAGVNSRDGNAVAKVMTMTGGCGVDTAIEAVGIPATFELCEQLVAPGGVIANIGVHGTKVDLHLESLWDRKHHDNHAPGRHRQHANAAQKPGVQEDRPQAPDHPSLQTRPDPRRLRHVWPRGQDESAQGDHRGLTHNHEHRAAAAQ
jgi:alcohol dehydrogenase